MSYEVIFRNNLVSLRYDDIRFGMFDSDGNYIDYLFYINEVEDFDIMKKYYIEQIKCLNEIQITEWIKDTFDILKIVPNCTSIDIEEYKELFGDEWVCRVGNTAIIICE